MSSDNQSMHDQRLAFQPDGCRSDYPNVKHSLAIANKRCMGFYSSVEWVEPWRVVKKTCAGSLADRMAKPLSVFLNDSVNAGFCVKPAADFVFPLATVK
jgi:hypothetical protein